MSAHVTITLSSGQVVAAVITAAALIAAIGYLIKKARAAMRVLHAAADVINRELNHNHGSSIKDDTYGTAVAFGALSRLVDNIDERLTDNIDRLTDHLAAVERNTRP